MLPRPRLASAPEGDEGPGIPSARGPVLILITGPASPRDVADLLSGRDRQVAEAIEGYRGIPVTELARALIAAGMNVEIATTATEVDERTTLSGPEFRLHVIPMRERPRDRIRDGFRLERRGLQSVIGESAPDVVHAHWTYEFAWAALDSGQPTVVTAHDAPLTILRHERTRYRAGRALIAYLVRTRIRVLTAVSPYLAYQWRKQMAYRRSIDIVPNPAPRIVSGERARRHSEHPFRIVDVADAGPTKNIVGLVRAFRELRMRRSDVVLQLVGPGLGPSDALPRALAGEAPCPAVDFLGPLGRSSLADVLNGADLFVHPSHEECCPMAVLEAMQAHVPVVAGLRSGGTPWVLDEGSAGLLVNFRNPSEVAATIDALLSDPGRREELARAGSERVVARFSPSIVANSMGAIYERASR